MSTPVDVQSAVQWPLYSAVRRAVDNAVEWPVDNIVSWPLYWSVVDAVREEIEQWLS